MSHLDITIDLLESNKKISNKILRALLEDVNKSFRSIIGKIENRIRAETISYLQGTGTYESLIDGDLAGHFGLVIGARKTHVDAILQVIANNIEVEFKEYRLRADSFVGGIFIRAIIADFSDILDLPQATQFTERFEPLPWLRWLLTAGDRIIIKKYEIRFYPGEGRSGKAIMMEDDAEVWRVPPEYSGTETNNWLTKDILHRDYLSIIDNIVSEEINRI